ncbi:MAG: hypothetical protein ABFS02_04300 [Pseudomonadota bacterium]
MKIFASMLCMSFTLILSFGCSVLQQSDQSEPPTQPTGDAAKQPTDYGQAKPSTSSDVSPPESGYASDHWLTKENTSWPEEMNRRDRQLYAYFQDTDPARSEKYGFRPGQTPALGWNWFTEHPVGYGGMPYVLLQTILSLDPVTEKDQHLIPLANIWKRKSAIPSESSQNLYTLDHLGVPPHPDDYENGVAKSPDLRKHRVPNGFVYDPTVKPKDVSAVDQRLSLMRDGLIGKSIKKIASLFGKDYKPQIAELLVLARGKIRNGLHGSEIDYQTESQRFQQPPVIDAVFFSCSGCHQGRVIVDGEIDDDGNTVKQGKMKFLPGMPNTEIEQQYFSYLLMETGLALTESGFSIDSSSLPNPDEIVPNKNVVKALFTRMLSRAMDPEALKTIYGPSPDQIKRAKLQTYWVAKDFPTYLGEMIGTAVKTQYIYYQVANKYAFNPDNPRRESPDQKVPHVIKNRIGQMDAFGVASGLVAIHAYRPDNSYIQFMYTDNPDNPIFKGIDTIPGFKGPVSTDKAGERILKNLENWAPPVPAPIDIKSLNWSGHRDLANWDGNQGAAARTLASGTSATGDSRKVNVRIHEPLNPLINNMPPPPYPFDIDREKALQGMTIYDRECSGCHKPNNTKIYPATKLGVDANRSMVNTDVSRWGLAGLVMEACNIFMRNNPDNDWCLPRDKQGQVITDRAKAYDDYFKDTPERVREGTNGYKADMLHGIWARAPYLHNGSVPTLMQMICPDTRPKQFKRGIIYYDHTMVGFEWQIAPKQRYSPYESQLVKDYDTREFGRSNAGHKYGSKLCPDTRSLDPLRDRKKIARRVSASKVGNLLEYLKTL